ncbi:MAG: SMC family ATPase, partial [Chloroflexi bacterium]|nr:SMC family ATPase [Chloroflexota bacterium]
MIPARLKMRNFMCYRNDVELSFAGIHTACITGDNGNGKSALIDAMTWALWGESRAKSDDDLVYQGEAGMLVEFDFAIGDQLYRIIRKHARPKRQNATGLSSLDLLVLSGAEGLAMSLPNRLAANGAGYQVVSGDSKRQTQQKINGILHMDYDTFVNSAYLRQGHAGEFTEQPPARRKDVLANILQLSHYDGLEEQAKESARRLEAKNLQLENSLAEIMQELAQ